MSLFTFNTFVSVVSEILFDDSLIVGHAFKTRLLLISFFIFFLEEKNNAKSDLKEIYKSDYCITLEDLPFKKKE